MRDPYSDIGIVKADGSMKIYNITESAYIDGNPHWVMDGNAVIYVSNRYGMRSHASWGSQNDVFIAFMNQDAYDKFQLNKEEYALMKEIEKSKKETKKDEQEKEEKAAKKDKKKDKKKGEAKEDKKEEKAKEEKLLEIDLDHLQDRVRRLTPMSSSLSGVALSKEGDKLYFMSSFEKGYDLWEMDVRERSMKILKKLGQGGAQLKMDKKGENLFLLSNGNLQKVETKGGKSSSIKYDASMKLDYAKEREYMFDHVFLQIEKRFFMKDHHGVDLEMMKKAYHPFLEHINNNYDYSEMLSEILGELNVSHTGSGYRPSGRGDSTAEFGVLLDLDYKGDGLKIAEVVAGSPFDKKSSKVTEGCIIEKIDGEAIEAGKDYYPMLNNKAGKQVLVEVYDPSKGDRWTETVKPISHGAMNNLLYDRWVKHNEETVKKLSNGRLGYVHIKSMGDASYRDVYSQILGKYNLCDGIVIDTRFNGGGRLHEDIEILFSGEKYLEQVINDSVACVMPSRRYNKPSVMIIGEANYSNAHGTPWVYKHKGMGSLVGMPVPGTMSSVTWETLQDPSLYFGLPVVGYRTEQGNWLENTQLEPDVKVKNTPEKMAAGIDEQLEAAVKELQKEVKQFHYWGK